MDEQGNENNLTPSEAGRPASPPTGMDGQGNENNLTPSEVGQPAAAPAGMDEPIFNSDRTTEKQIDVTRTENYQPGLTPLNDDQSISTPAEVRKVRFDLSQTIAIEASPTSSGTEDEDTEEAQGETSKGHQQTMSQDVEERQASEENEPTLVPTETKEIKPTLFDNDQTETGNLGKDNNTNSTCVQDNSKLTTPTLEESKQKHYVAAAEKDCVYTLRTEEINPSSLTPEHELPIKPPDELEFISKPNGLFPPPVKHEAPVLVPAPLDVPALSPAQAEASVLAPAKEGPAVLTPILEEPHVLTPDRDESPNLELAKEESPVLTPADPPVLTLTKAETPALTPVKEESPTLTPANVEALALTPANFETPALTPAEVAAPALAPTLTDVPFLTPAQAEVPVSTPVKDKSSDLTPPQAEAPELTPAQSEAPISALPQAEAPVSVPDHTVSPTMTPAKDESPVSTLDQAEAPVIVTPAIEELAVLTPPQSESPVLTPSKDNPLAPTSTVTDQAVSSIAEVGQRIPEDESTSSAPAKDPQAPASPTKLDDPTPTLLDPALITEKDKQAKLPSAEVDQPALNPMVDSQADATTETGPCLDQLEMVPEEDKQVCCSGCRCT